MAHFENLSNNKQNFIQQFLDDENLVKCLANNQPDFLNYEVPDKSSLIYNHIYPCKYIPQTNETAKAFIAIGFRYDPSASSSRYYRTSYVTFYIFCHSSLIHTSYGALRYDYALQRVDAIMNCSRSKEWIGQMEFDNAEDDILDSKGEYVGICVSYRSGEIS